MELTLKEMAQIAKAKQDAEKKEQDKIMRQKDAKAIELRDMLLNEIQTICPSAIAKKGVFIGEANIYLPYKGYTVIYGYNIRVFYDGVIEVSFSHPTFRHENFTEKMSKQELAEKVLVKYL